jgi:hypothetical protein
VRVCGDHRVSRRQCFVEAPACGAVIALCERQPSGPDQRTPPLAAQVGRVDAGHVHYL